MAGEDKEFLKRLLATFRVEADDHLKAMSSLLLQLESHEPNGQALGVMEALFREAHSLKGAARAVNLNAIETVCQALESGLAGFRQKGTAPPSGAFDILHRALDMIEQLLAADGDASQVAIDVAALVQALGGLSALAADAQAVASAATAVAEPAAAAIRSVPAQIERDSRDTVRISTARLGALMVQVEELLAFKFGAEHFLADMRELQADVATWRKAWVKHAGEARALRRLADRIGYAATTGKNARVMARLLQTIESEDSFGRQLSERIGRLERGAARERRALSGMVDNLLEEMKLALMLPFSSLLELFPKLVRDLAQDCGKKVDLTIEGDVLEIDRRVLEQIKDPLIHLVRNAIDHGIETPDERLRKGKPQRGRIRIEIVPRDGNKVELLVADDGGGIDLMRVLDSAVADDLITADTAEKLDQREALALIFESGLSTSTMVTEMSGRGVGLAIVREKVERLGGSVEVERQDVGTRFVMILPTSLTTFRGLLTRVGERRFVLPARNVERVARVPASAVKTVRHRDTIEFDGATLALVRLGDLLAVPHDAGQDHEPATHLTVLLLGAAERQIAFVVDQILGDQDVLVKSLGPLLPRVRHIAGATVLGAGNVVPVLSVPDLLKSALRVASEASTGPARSRQQPVSQRAVLLAEDSITSRSLLKNILESAGYTVNAVVDGVEAFAALRTGSFDLLVSDVEMPRMDGFTLTARVRADKRLAELPVVLVTSLDSREHRERGVEAGANAYIVKSSFDQSNLLEVVRRLL